MTEQAHSQRAHARLAPSAAKRWMTCPGSVRMSEGIADTTSSFAAEGTAAHELAAHCLDAKADPTDFAGCWIDIHPDEPKQWLLAKEPATIDPMRHFVIDDEMTDAVGIYVEHVRSLCDAAGKHTLEVEQRLDMTHLHPEIFGTGDATVFDHGASHLHVVDLKYGKGVAVDATENPQLMLYAAGAARRHHNLGIQRLTMHIVQPRAPHVLGPIRQYDIDLFDLFDFEAVLSEAAKRTEDPDAPLVAGEHCRFCKALPICATARESALQAAADDFGAVDVDALPLPEAMSAEHRGRVLRQADSLFTWVKAVQEHEHAQAVAGNLPDGFKLVAKRAVRKWVDEDAAKSTLYDMGATNDDILTEPKLKSPAQCEKLFPGKNKAEREKAMADLVKKESSGVNLVPASDPRPAVVTSATEEFGAVDAT